MIASVVDRSVQEYVEGISPANRSLFERLHRLLLEAHPQADAGISYRIPTYRLGKRRLYLGAWRHGLSIYGWQEGRDAGFSARHPDLKSGKATIRLRPRDAELISDEEFRELLRASLED